MIVCLLRKHKGVCRMTETEKIKKLTKNFLCLNEDGKTYTAALVEALAQASTAAVSYNLADGGPNITSPGQTGEAWKSGK